MLLKQSFLILKAILSDNELIFPDLNAVEIPEPKTIKANYKTRFGTYSNFRAETADITQPMYNGTTISETQPSTSQHDPWITSDISALR